MVTGLGGPGRESRREEESGHSSEPPTVRPVGGNRHGGAEYQPTGFSEAGT